MGNRIKQLPIVGGDWNNGGNAGVFALNVNNASSNSNNNVGGCDSASNILELNYEMVEHRDAVSSVSEIDHELPCLSNLAVENPRRSKRIGYLFEEAFSESSLYLAYLEARKGKTHKPSTLKFSVSVHTEIKQLHQELMSGEYRPRKLRTFMVYEPKERIIHAPYFRDLVVQHAIYRVIYSIFDNGFIDQSYACRKGGGTHKASNYTQSAMRRCDGELYYVKMDIRKFFYSINRDILMDLFRKKIKDQKMINVMEMFVRIDDNQVGLPIGNLLSQLFALVYLNPLDHFVKRELKAKNYVRYVDDFICIGVSYDEAVSIKQKCELFCQKNLALEFSKWTIAKIKSGINFVGYRTWRSVKFVRRHSVSKFKKAVGGEKINSVASLIGHASHSATIVFYSQYLHLKDFIKFLTKRSRQLCLNILNLRPLKTTIRRCDLSTTA